MLNKNSFTLIETLVAISLLTVGTVGAFTLIQKTIAFTSVVSSQLQASYLSQEGIEIVRNIRDTNYLKGENWNEGLPQGDWPAETLLTKFERIINIAYAGDQMLVSVEVSWQERGREHEVVAQTELYNWR